MTETENKVLSKLFRSKGKSLGELFTELDMKKKNISATLSSLKQRGKVNNFGGTGWRLSQ